MQRITDALNEQDQAVLDTTVWNNTQFALDLYHKLRKTEVNLFFSPYSISAVLALTYAGAGGDTAGQMAQTLHFTQPPEELHGAFARLQAVTQALSAEGKAQLSVANSLWPQAGRRLVQAYLALAAQYYGAQIVPVDYRKPRQAAETINRWVEEMTAEKIKDLVTPDLFDASTLLVLTNAIYFKGIWGHPFDPAATEEQPFHIAPGEQVSVPMMTQQRSFGYGGDAQLHILELPYVGNLSMVVLLPRAIDGLAKLEESLTAENLLRWTQRRCEMEVRVSLPRFALTAAFRLDEALKRLGMIDAFSDRSDFSAMSRAPAHISAVLHKAFVAVNEEGTEAAAATAVVMWLKAMRSINIRADHPFLFLIRENSTQTILFMGRVVDPAAGG